MSPEVIAVIAGLIVAWLVFTWAIKVLRASFSTAIAIAIILFVLQVLFGIRYQEFWQFISQFVQQLLER